MSKESISNDSMSQMKKKFLIDKIKEKRKAIIVGSYPGNIAFEINKKLIESGIETVQIDKQNGSDQDITVKENVERISKDFKDTDILVLANSDMQLKWFEESSDEEIDHIMTTNLTSTMKFAKSWINETMQEKHKKYIVLIGSMAYNNVLNGSTPYCVSKAGIAMFARCLAWELAPKNYNVIAIHPSNTQDAPMSKKTINELEKFRNISHEDAVGYWSAVCPKGRFLSKEEIANIAKEFISGKVDYLSGANIELRGGQR